MVSSFRDA